MLTNIQKSVSKKGILTIKIDLNKNYGASSSGKSELIASSKGNVQLKDNAGTPIEGVKLGLNVYKLVK